MYRPEWWRYWGPELPELEGKWFSVDCAFKDTKDSDFVAIQVWGERRDEYFLLDQVLRRLDAPATAEEIKSLHARWGPRYILVEDKANGPAVIQMLRRQISGLVAVNPLGGKASRASAVAHLVKEGRVFVPRPLDKPWVEAFMSEMTAFPNAPHDDQVDAFSHALARFAGSEKKAAEEAEKAEKSPRARKWMFQRPKVVRDAHFGPGLDDAAAWEAMQT
jgi:predicted phage terminase large subunit-like protein